MRFKVQPSRWPPEVASLIIKETEVLNEGKLQITSTQLQINLKFQPPMTETHFHRPGAEGNYGFGSTTQWRYLEFNLQ